MARSTLSLVIGCVLVTLTQSGCATSSPENRRLAVLLEYPHATSPTLTRTSEEHYHHVSRMAAEDSRALAEDLDLFFLTDRPSRLTRWPTK